MDDRELRLAKEKQEFALANERQKRIRREEEKSSRRRKRSRGDFHFGGLMAVTPGDAGMMRLRERLLDPDLSPIQRERLVEEERLAAFATFGRVGAHDE